MNLLSLDTDSNKTFDRGLNSSLLYPKLKKIGYKYSNAPLVQGNILTFPSFIQQSEERTIHLELTKSLELKHQCCHVGGRGMSHMLSYA